MEAEVRSALTQHDALNDRVSSIITPPTSRGVATTARCLSLIPPTAVLNWGYNAWGEKYPPYDLDNAVPEHIAPYAACLVLRQT